jgi:sigma-B regulation protein RsbU (phosphoserine phosphatase)
MIQSVARRFTDLSRNKKLPALMNLVQNLSLAEAPRDVLRVFLEAMLQMHGARAYAALSVEPGGERYRVTQFRRADRPEPGNGKARREPPLNEGGFFGELVAGKAPRLAKHLHVADDPIMGRELAAFRSLIAVPIFEQGEVTDWAILLDPAPDFFDTRDVEDLVLRANLIGMTARNVRMAEQLQHATDRIQLEVNRIAAIQRALLPERLPEIPGLSLAASYHTFDRAGGDIYDLTPMRPCPFGPNCDLDGPWGILIADVSGHGPSAAVVMAMLHSSLRSYPREPSGPAELLEHLNRFLQSKRIEQNFVTAFLTIYDPADGSFLYSGAGHNPPLVKSPGYGGEVRHLDDASSVPLGIVDHPQYTEARITLAPGETLLLYTDGITEAAGPGGKMFGIEGLDKALANCAGDPECVIGTVNTVLRKHEAGLRPKDDQTLLAIQRKAE